MIGHVLCSYLEHYLFPLLLLLLFTKDPFPLETPGALGYSPLSSFPFALLSTLRVVFLHRTQRLSMR
jgi:hypothetical protein